MRKYLLFVFTLLAMCSCGNEDEGQNNSALSVTKETTAFVKLADGTTDIAGVIKIVADVPEAELMWGTTPICNLDTTQTTVALKNGIGELPVRWLNKQQNGGFAPEATAFKAWVRIKTGDKLTDVPLILSERLDSTSLLQSVQTRAGEMMPRVTSFTFEPAEVNLQTATGGNCQLKVEGPGELTVDYSGIKDEYKIDKTNLPETVKGTTTLNFKWKGGVAPTIAFNVVIRASDGESWTSCTLKYDPNGTGGDVDLRYVDNTMPPMGNLPATSNIYTFNFEGTYAGAVQLRTLSEGEILYTATAYQYPVTQPRARVPKNEGAERAIQFEYRAGTETWIPIEGVNRIQDGTGVTPPIPGDVPSYTPITPSGDIPDGGGIYSTIFSNYEGTVEFRAVRENDKELANTSVEVTAAVSKQASLEIPEAMSVSDNKVIFQYRIIDGEWTTMETRKQLFETFTSGSIEGLPGVIPKSGGTYYYGSGGTLSARLTIFVKDDFSILYQNSGAVGDKIRVIIPANTTGKPRELFFWYERSDQPGKLKLIQRGSQAGA